MHRAARLVGAASVTLAVAMCSFGPAASATRAADVINVSFMGWDNPGPVNAALKIFNSANPTIHATFTQTPYAQYDARLNTMEVAGTQPDIVELEEYNIPVFGAKGVLYPLDGLLKANGLGNDLLPSSIFRANGSTWGVGNGSTTYLLYYNPALFQKAGVAPPPTDPKHPWTWTQFVAAAKKLTVDSAGKHPGDSGFDAKKIQVYGTYEPAFWLHMLALVRSTGVGFFNPDATRFTLADKPAVAAVQAIANLSLVDHVAPTPALMASFPSAATMVATGRMAMAISGTWDLNTFGSVKFHEGVAAIPMFKAPQNTAWTAGYAISKNSKHAAAAWSVLHSLLTYPTVYQLGQQMPPFKSWFTDPSKYKLWAGDPAYHPVGFQQIASGTLLDPAIGVQGENVYVKNFGKMMDNFVTPGLDPVFAGKQTAAQALPAIAAQVQPLVQGRWK